MNTRAGKNRENQIRTAANSASKKESGRNGIFQFVDNCPEAMQLRKLQGMANNSPQVKSVGGFAGSEEQ
jgi:hypothetical protein